MVKKFRRRRRINARRALAVLKQSPERALFSEGGCLVQQNYLPGN
jgi:hypothetical protein